MSRFFIYKLCHLSIQDGAGTEGIALWKLCRQRKRKWQGIRQGGRIRVFHDGGSYLDRRLLGLSRGEAGFQAGIQEQGEDSQGKAGGQGGGNGKTPGEGGLWLYLRNRGGARSSDFSRMRCSMSGVNLMYSSAC